MIPSIRCGLVTLLLLLASPTALAEESAALQTFIREVQTLSADFVQVQRDERGVELQRLSGQLWLARPRAGRKETGRFHWAYQQPYVQLLVCDGREIWIYEPDLAQATVRPAVASLSGTPAEILSRPEALTQQFEIRDGGARNGARVVLLTPRDSAGDFSAIELLLRVDGAPEALNFEDTLGGRTEVRFSATQVNPAVADTRFAFQVPEGVELIRTGVAP